MEGVVRPAGVECELFNDHIFRELRAYAQVPEHFANTDWSLKSLEHGGGKGGTQMARIGDAYIIKELSKGDHKALLEVTGSYGQHVRSGETLLCPIYLHFRHSGRFFFAMRNSIGSGPFNALYDLKGCADDKLLEEDGEPIKAVHKRVWNVGMWCKANWSKERRAYYEGKVKARDFEIPLTPEQRAQCLSSLERDTAWLAQHSLMDYSLLVAVKNVPMSASGGRGLGHRPLLFKSRDGREVAVNISIIDFLQKWTMGKRVARCVKCAECNKATIPPSMYARRFYHHFAHRLIEALETCSDKIQESNKTLAAVAPPAGDCEEEGMPEDRLNSRPVPEERAVPPGGPPPATVPEMAAEEVAIVGNSAVLLSL
mmetsp:Transcript_20498/g.52090  ORF Transcript_20498/g.52090 Transcript_20498/m.52090 type:complete len:370 (-) Transcript_20498:217-1326(-)